MSQNKGKAKTSPARKTGKSTKSTAGIAKRATMNKRSPKEPMAISGDTMSNYAMYKAGGNTPPVPAGLGQAIENHVLNKSYDRPSTFKKKMGGSTKAKKFAALAPPYDKITAADRIAGAKKNKRKK